MSKQTSKLKNTKLIVYGSTLAVWLATNALNLTSDVSQSAEKFQTSVLKLKIIQILITLPVLVIYLSVSYAVVHFIKYQRKIKNAPEGEGYGYLTKALIATLASFLLSSVINAYRTYKYGSSVEFTAVDSARIYVGIIVGLAVFWFFYQGSLRLAQTLKDKPLKLPLWLYAVLGTISALFTFLVFNNPNRTFAEGVRPTYGVSDPYIFFTIVIPLILSWTLGLFAVFYLIYYSRQVKGIIFRQLFSKLAKALVAIISLNIGLQLLSQFSDSLAGASLSIVLLLIAVILIVMAWAYYLVAQAAKSLHKIEVA
jgi:hypothetical protein